MVPRGVAQRVTLITPAVGCLVFWVQGSGLRVQGCGNPLGLGKELNPQVLSGGAGTVLASRGAAEVLSPFL